MRIMIMSQKERTVEEGFQDTQGWLRRCQGLHMVGYKSPSVIVEVSEGVMRKVIMVVSHVPRIHEAEHTMESIMVELQI